MVLSTIFSLQETTLALGRLQSVLLTNEADRLIALVERSGDGDPTSLLARLDAPSLTLVNKLGCASASWLTPSLWS